MVRGGGQDARDRGADDAGKPIPRAAAGETLTGRVFLKEQTLGLSSTFLLRRGSYHLQRDASSSVNIAALDRKGLGWKFGEWFRSPERVAAEGTVRG